MAKCIRTPQNKSKKVIILSRSSNDHNNGDKQPRSINIQATANRQLKTRVNSNINKRKLAKCNDNKLRNKISKTKQNKCSLQQTLQ